MFYLISDFTIRQYPKERMGRDSKNYDYGCRTRVSKIFILTCIISFLTNRYNLELKK